MRGKRAREITSRRRERRKGVQHIRLHSLNRRKDRSIKRSIASKRGTQISVMKEGGERRRKSAFHAKYIYIYMDPYGQWVDSSSIFSFVFAHKSKFFFSSRINKEWQPSKHVRRFRVHSRNNRATIDIDTVVTRVEWRIEEKGRGSFSTSRV